MMIKITDFKFLTPLALKQSKLNKNTQNFYFVNDNHTLTISEKVMAEKFLLTVNLQNMVLR